MISKLIKCILKNKSLASYLRGKYKESLTEIPPESNVAEAQPINCRKSNFTSPRLNLLVPAISTEHFFGGASTAVSFFETLGFGLENLRIILTEQETFSPGDNPVFAHWHASSLDDEDVPGLTIVAAGDRYGHTLSVGPNDRFIATAWWTAVSANHIQQWQSAVYKLSEPNKFVYLIQDFEPGFYPWSSRYALAESTYHGSERFIAVFNTSLLKSFFDSEKYSFPYFYVFEPKLHPNLREQLKYCKDQQKEKRVLIYGRPSVARNAFQLIVMSLREWVANNPGCDWTFVSVGEKHPPVDLGSGRFLISLGKLSLSDYAAELLRASVGISLMISPHPSYPPLEMAAFGIRTITNIYKCKDLSLLTKNIVSIDCVDPTGLAAVLDKCMREPASTHISESGFGKDPRWTDYLESSVDFESMCSAIRPQLFREKFSSIDLATATR